MIMRLLFLGYGEHIIFSSVPDKFRMVEVHLSCDVGGGGESMHPIAQ